MGFLLSFGGKSRTKETFYPAAENIFQKLIDDEQNSMRNG